MNRLIPNTGIQYLSIPAIPLDRFKRHDFRLRRGPHFHQVMPYAATGQRSDPSDDFDGTVSLMRNRSADMVVLEQLLVCRPEGVWVPLPFEGGALWVSAFLRRSVLRSTQEPQIEVCLAVDTTLESDGNPDGLGIEELGPRAPSPCSVRFWRHPGVRAWLSEIVHSLPDTGRKPDQMLEDLQVAVAGLADLLAQTGARGDSMVTLEKRPAVSDGIVVDLILDLGNSRTCALLEERMNGGRRQGLELVYPDNPGRSESSPFSTQSAFFEHLIAPRVSGGTASFRFLSLLKLGNGALDALAQRDQDPRPLGLSTPKRYLWDDYDRVEWNWRFANRLDAQGISPPIEGDLVRRMDPASVFKPPVLMDLVQPDHPRLACMVWTIVELLEQAFRQMNSPQWRRTEAQAPHHDRRRTIGSVVLTYPAGLHSTEIRNFEQAARTACRLWSQFRSSPVQFSEAAGDVSIDDRHGVPLPRVQVICDEGMAIQLCWLYGEAVHRFASNPGQLVESVGRIRDGAHVLRLASIDIGGGTVDLAVADHKVHGDLRANVAFTCTPLFHDSISRAGDDILRGILEEHVFRAIREQFGCSSSAWNRVFSSASAPEDSVRELRRKLVRALWVPVATAFLEKIESAPGPAGSPDVIVSVRIGDECRSSRLLDELSKELRRGAKPAPEGCSALEDVVVRMTRAQMRSVVRNTIGRTIDQCADIVDQYDCDLLVVGGRPSGNPEIREQIYASMAVPPGQVVFLSELAVDDWYPFADGSGRIGDAKTCGAVGGAVAFCGRYGHPGLGSFFIKFDEPRELEQPPIMGVLVQTSGVPLFGDAHRIDLSADARRIPFVPTQPLLVASRRVASGDAEARPTFRVRLKRSLQADLQQVPALQKPVEVRFKSVLRDPRDEPAAGDQVRVHYPDDCIEFRDITGTVLRRGRGGQTAPIDADRALELRLCTLLDSGGYWIDTGEFAPQDEIDA